MRGSTIPKISALVFVASEETPSDTTGRGL